MRSSFLPFSRPSISQADIDAVTEVMRSGWLTTGPKAAKFEEKFCEYVGCRGAVAMTSATAAMHVTLKALGIGPGDEVITPSMTWVSTVNLIVLSGATPVFADVDRETMMLTTESVEACITERTKMVIPVHFAGAPANMDGLRALCKKHGLILLEDAAHAVGTEYKGQLVGNSGTSIFSFHPIKNITTGEGGMLCSDDEALLERVRRLKFHGLGVDAFDRKMQGRSPQAEVIEPGYKYNLPDMQAVLGVTQLARVDEFNSKRTELAEIYRRKLAGFEGILPLGIPTYEHKHANHLFIVRVEAEKAGIGRDGFMAELKKINIGTGLHFRAVHLQKYYVESMGMKRGMLPNTEWNSDRICSLPLFPEMTSEDVEDVVNAIGAVLDGSK